MREFLVLMREFLWLAGAVASLTVARALDHAQRDPDFWRRVNGETIAGICWLLFVVCVVKWMGK